ncbi:hypothetical protein GALMADRAFT_140109 [Galerina marginata CBS 339.88]|uniref:Uncharacterized protein n=1 Tax=Galerina marginata (strain CBS 339.88) TaxID=685588 RepID=A0A067TBQ5_GALM3|nr:hypothetical protein GALMADRAFT_140109 [Galerina marginata CBS 339.88]
MHPDGIQDLGCLEDRLGDVRNVENRSEAARVAGCPSFARPDPKDLKKSGSIYFEPPSVSRAPPPLAEGCGPTECELELERTVGLREGGIAEDAPPGSAVLGTAAVSSPNPPHPLRFDSAIIEPSRRHD